MSNPVIEMTERERRLGEWLARDGYLLFRGRAGGYGIGPDNGTNLPTTIGWDYRMTLDDVAAWIENAQVIAGHETRS